MPSLHRATVGTYLQLLPALGGLLAKAKAHCRTQGLPDEVLTTARLTDDMWPFAKQVMSAVQHSAGAIAAAPTGAAGPDTSEAPLDFASLSQAVAQAIAYLETVDAAALDGIADDNLRFDFRTAHMDFTVADFLLSFSLPSFHFHMSTAYALLRHSGLAIGKADFLGRLRFKSRAAAPSGPSEQEIIDP